MPQGLAYKAIPTWWPFPKTFCLVFSLIWYLHVFDAPSDRLFVSNKRIKMNNKAEGGRYNLSSLNSRQYPGTDSGSTVVKVLCQLVSVDFSLKSFRSHYGPGVDLASNRNEYREYFQGVKVAGA